MSKKRAKKRRHHRILHTVKRRLLKGNTALYLLIIIVVLGATAFTGGVVPKFDDSTIIDRNGPGVLDEESLKNEPGRDVLQLLPIRFKDCSEQVSVVMMLDRTGSMENDNKLQRLKDATLQFTGGFSDESIIGIQSFSANSITEDIPVSYYKDVKDQIAQKVNAYTPGGATPTHDAIRLSKNVLEGALVRYPDRKFSYIFVSDGLPNPAGKQDPYLIDPNPVNQIKDMGVEIYTIGIFSPYETSGMALMLRIASKPGNFYNSSNGSNLEDIYNKIADKICGS